MFLDKKAQKQARREGRAKRKAAKRAGRKPEAPHIEMLSAKAVYYLGSELMQGQIAGRGANVAMIFFGPTYIGFALSVGELQVPWDDVTYWAELRTADVPGYHGKFAATKVAEYALGGVIVGAAGRHEDEANAERSAVVIAYLADGGESMVYVSFYKQKDLEAMEHHLTERLGPPSAHVRFSPTQIDEAWWQASNGLRYPPAPSAEITDGESLIP